MIITIMSVKKFININIHYGIIYKKLWCKFLYSVILKLQFWTRGFIILCIAHHKFLDTAKMKCQFFTRKKKNYLLLTAQNLNSLIPVSIFIKSLLQVDDMSKSILICDIKGRLLLYIVVSIFITAVSILFHL